MGGESSGGSENSMSNEQLNRAKRNREAKERQASFNQYNRMQKPSPEGGAAQLPSQKTMNTVQDNISIAQGLERKAKSSQINLPVPTIGSVAMNTVSSLNYNNQAKQLRSGGNAVFDNKGEYRGVVSDGRYSGNADYSPIGRSQGVSFNSATGNYTSSQMQSSGGDDNSQSSNNTPSNTQTTAIDKTDSTTSLSTASRRSLITGGGPDAKRRIFTV